MSKHCGNCRLRTTCDKVERLECQYHNYNRWEKDQERSKRYEQSRDSHSDQRAS